MKELRTDPQRANRALGCILTAAGFTGLAAGQAWGQNVSPQQPDASAAGEKHPVVATAESDVLQEIVVTANKRSESIQQVPIAITAVTGDRLAGIGITNTQDLAAVVPGLTIQNSLSGTQAHLRGVGTTALSAGTENSVATYIDGVYILSLSGALVQLNNIEQVEVDKGPQGTLFGRNATGGVINIRTRDPSHEVRGDFNIRYGNYNTVSTQAYVTGGITQTVAADVAAFVSYQADGWGKNLFNGEDVNRMDQYALRSKWLIEPDDRDRLRVIGDFSELKGNSFASFAPLHGTAVNYGPGNTTAAQRPDLAGAVAGGALAPFAVVGDPYTYLGGFYDVDMERQPQYQFKTGGGSLQWDHEFDSVKLTSITAYRRADQSVSWDSVPLPVLRSAAAWSERDTQLSQEFQVGSAGEATIPWVAGLYYLDGKAEYNPFFIEGSTLAPVQRLTFHASTTTKSGAAFGQATAPLWAGAHLTGGFRYTVERRGIAGDTVADFLPAFAIPEAVSGITDAHKTFSKPTWRVALDQQLTSDILGYVSYNRGFKSGLYNSIPPGGADAKAIEPEVLDAYEAGIKTDLFERRVRLNVAGYYYDYKNLQVTVFTPVSAVLDNGAGAHIYGADLDLTARLVSNLTLFAGANVMKSEFTSYPQAGFNFPQPASAGGGTNKVNQSAKGNRLPYAPNTTFNIGADYNVPLGEGGMSLKANYSYSGLWYAGPDNILSQSHYGLLDASLTYRFPRGRLELGVWGRNLTAEKYYVFLAAQSNPGGYEQGLVGAPRTFGGTIRYKF